MTRNGVLSVAALYFLNTVTVQSLQWIRNNVTEFIRSWEANSCSATHSIPRLLQNIRVITISTTAWLTPSQLTSSAHLSSILTYIIHWTTSLLQPICLVHFKRHADTPKWETKKLRHWQTTEPLTDLNLLFLNWHKRHQTKTQTTNTTNHNLNYIYWIPTIKQKSQSSMTNTTPKLSCLY
jgi:hypothetical protein